MSELFRQVLASVDAASPAHGKLARERLRNAELPQLTQVGSWLASVQRTAIPHCNKPTLLLLAADHAIADPGVRLGANHPTAVALGAIQAGNAALATLVRAAKASLVVVDCGTDTPLDTAGVVPLRGHNRAFGVDTPALTIAQVSLGLDAGLALALSLIDQGVDVLALASLGLGTTEAAAALTGALTGALGTNHALSLDADQANFVALGQQIAAGAEAGKGALSPLAIVEHFGNHDLAVALGVCVMAASLHVPVIVDDGLAIAAAALATRLSPAMASCVCFAHIGHGASAELVRQSGNAPAFHSVVGNGEGAAAAMTLGLAALAADLLRPNPTSPPTA